MRFSCCVTTATDTEYLIPPAFPLQQWLHERASLRYNTMSALLHLRVREFC
jgi:hypothetical protein